MSLRIRRIGIYAGVLACLAGTARFAGAQANTSSGLVGEVKDSSGGVLPGATIIATHVATGAQQTVVTDAEGRYRIPALAQGEYRFEAALSGFQTQVMTGVVLTVGRTLAADFTLSVGALSESVTVEAGAPLVETQSSSGAGLVSGEQIRDLPLNNSDASYGKKAGGQVSIVTRSGTNQFRGSVFAFMRNDIFDARDFFDAKKAPLHPHNNGFSLGGPIAANRSFFFSNYERYRERRGLTLVATAPAMAVRQGIFPDGSRVNVHPDVAPILALYPVPNGRDHGDGTAEARTPVIKAADDHYFVTRFDHEFTGSQSLFGR